MKLKAGTGGRGKLIVKAKGENIPPLPLPMTGPVTVQLINGNGECWGAEYTIKKNTSLFFKGKR